MRTAAGIALFLFVCLLSRSGRADWKSEWDQIVRAAEKEGQVNVYIAGYSAIVDSGVFQKAYPKIRIVSVTGSGTDLTTRLASERRAGKYIADVYSAPAIKLLDELLPGKK